MLPIEIAASSLSIVYVVLAALNTRWCFPLAVIASALWAYTSWFEYNLLYDSVLQVFYLIMAVVGFFMWSKQDQVNNKPIKFLSLKQSILFVVGGLFVSFAMQNLVGNYISSSHSYLDATTTVFSVFATVLLLYRIIDTWIYLLICNILYIYIYTNQGAKAFAIMMVIYSIMAIVGYISWKREQRSYLS